MHKLIGEILIEGGYVSFAELNEARRKQMRQSGVKIGELLIQNGSITREQLEWALRIQNSKPRPPERSAWA